VCRIINNGIYVKVRIEKRLFSLFKIIKVLRKVEAISILLFNIVLETAVTRSKGETWGYIFEKSSQFIVHADVVVIIGRSQDFEEIFTSLVAERNKVGKK
jgi:hypothetical protein